MTQPGDAVKLWTHHCDCGQIITDEYHEYVTGTVEAAMRELLPQQRPSNNGKSSGRRQHLAQIVARLVATTVATLSDRASDIIQGAGRNLSEWRKSQHGRRERRDGDDPYRPTQGGTDLHSPEPAQPRYLFVCFTQHKKYEWTEMVPICMNVSTDKDLFVVLRCRYNAKVGIWRRILGLKRLTEFRFVQFRITIHRLVEILAHSEMAEGLREKAYPCSRHPDYSYRPDPTKMWPPVAKNILMHLYTCPTICDKSPTKDFCIQRFPKYRDGDVTIDDDTQEAFEWGVELVEGTDWAYLWVIGLLGIVLGVVVGVVYFVWKRDIPGAF